MDVVHEVWQRVYAVQPAPPSTVVLGAAVVALVLVLWSPAWSLTRHVVTIAHEGAHCVAAVLTGRRLSGIRLHSDTSGLTVSRGRPRGPGMVLTLAAGYVGPGLVGLGAAALLGAGHAVGLLWGLLLLLALLLLQIRNFFGLWSVLFSGAVVFAVSWFLPTQAQSAFAYLVTWFLLLAAPRTVAELQVQRSRGAGAGSDADQLARLTHLPGLAWVDVFLLVTVGALLLGGSWILV
ncbi:M50 family metallopeptidase [Oryzihumus sp.]